MNPNHQGPSCQPGSSPKDIERAAAKWVVRQQHPLSRAEQAQFEQWLQCDPRHAGIYAEMSETSGLLEKLQALPSAVDASPDRGGSRRAGRTAWWVSALAAAAAIAAMGPLRSRPPVEPASFVQTVVAEKGSLRKINLPDGSVVQLNVESAVEVNFLPGERRVRLTKGEAHFTVAHDSSRPFTVNAGGVAVRAVGAAFDVRFGDEAVEVLVTQGKVRVTDAVNGESLLASTNETPELVAGQFVQIPAQRTASCPLPVPAIQVDSAEIQRRVAWKDQRLEFSAVSLAEVVAEFNRHNEHQLKIADPALATLRFGGSFTPHGYEALVELLEQSFGVVAERRDHETILRRRP